MSKSKDPKSEFELLEAHLTLQVKQHMEGKGSKGGKGSYKKAAKEYIQVSMMLGKWSIDGTHWVPMVVDVEAIDNAIAEMEARRAARKLGYQDRDIRVDPEFKRVWK